MLHRATYLHQLEVAVGRSPITALLGSRQCGKTTLAREFAAPREATCFDLESEPDLRRLANPELVLGGLDGLVVLDEIQRAPHLFNVLRVLVDRPQAPCRYLILGSASPDLVRGVSESLAGRVEFVELAGFDLAETTTDAWRNLWLRGGLPPSYLAASDGDSMAWRDGFVRTFLERDIPQLGITIPAAAMRRFWTMLAHWHGQTWNASELGRAMSTSDKTVRSYLDVLTGTYMVRQLQPWFENTAKRQVKAPKVYLRDPGILHTLLGIADEGSLLSHPRVGASWEGFAIEQVLRALRPAQAWFWGSHSGGEVDLLVLERGRRIGFEVKFSEAPDLTRSMHNVIDTLNLDHLFVVCPTPNSYPVQERISILSIFDCPELPNRVEETLQKADRHPSHPAAIPD
ncbi:MAG: ATP-binding protein [Gammaproteobacteria bacterium]|nr:ATP-binding protein [Gammaproteobacteria bacterium]